MLFFTPGRVLANMEAAAPSLAAVSSDMSTLRADFFQALMRKQGLVYPLEKHRTKLTLKDEKIQRYLEERNAFSEDASNLIRPVPESKKSKIHKHFLAGEKILAEADPTLAATCSLVAANVIILDGRSCDVESGSLYTNLGLIYICPSDDWTDLDYSDHLLHESVHNALFIEDMVRGIFYHGVRCSMEQNQVVSSIRKVRRNFDLSFHAACVSLVLGKFYSKIGRADKVLELLEPLTVTVDELVKVAKRTSGQGTCPLKRHGLVVLDQLNLELSHFYKNLRL